ncbi:MAG: HEPN domain-containing protein [Cyanobacteria bacterium J06627_28]
MIENLPIAHAWFRKAEKDISALKALMKAPDLFDAATFHAQQAAEKYLKGYLAFRGVTNIPKTHNLVALNKLCRDCGDDLNLEIAMLSELTIYAVDTRYDLDFSPDMNLIESASLAVQQVKEAVLSLVDKLSEEDQSQEN